MGIRIVTTWVLLTAMPPTKGHLDLVSFACEVDSSSKVEVLVVTQPDEPLPLDRYYAIVNSFSEHHQVGVTHIHKTLPQDPETPGFQDMWNGILKDHGAQPGDCVVASEPYGIWLAKGIGGRFMPYDPDRTLRPTKAEKVRSDPVRYFSDIAPEFQHLLRTEVVIFGAESTGKTTLSRQLAQFMRGHWFFEWARPYLETVGPEITVESMTDIWEGQLALQAHAVRSFRDKPFHIFDTDLYSTVGYWELPHWKPVLGEPPSELIKDATSFKADLYIICPSNIPFEEDPLRYGGDHRESDDQYWIDLAEKYELPYVVLENHVLEDRVYEAYGHIREIADLGAVMLNYDRGGL
jgi:HTH-type transcriptional repressor of NAD biosynthesis genes